MQTIKRTKVVDALKRTDYGQIVNVRGWVRTHRSSKAVDFIALNDGSTIKNIQVVVDPTKFDADLLKQITTGACINVNGELVESQGAGQSARLKSMDSAATTSPCRRRVRALNTCASMLICACAPTPSEP